MSTKALYLIAKACDIVELTLVSFHNCFDFRLGI
jgi:hypothetical protein